ncbi:hypothetical protein [Nocardia sp. NPDC052566]|uniref:hypothetical protein n=1 Tax=Nocardia sp. NPDC052566 TaxID=3364330 RepID=UPI0037CB23C3
MTETVGRPMHESERGIEKQYSRTRMDSMGCIAEFTGELTVNPPLNERETELVEDVFGYGVSSEGAVITIHVATKPSATMENLEDLLELLARGRASEIDPDTIRFLTTPPTMHVISGQIEYMGEESGEITIENSQLSGGGW